MYDEEKFAQLEQSAEKATIANVVDLGDVIDGALEFVSDPGGSVFFAVVIFLIAGAWFLIKFIFESFSGGPSQGLLG